MKTLDEVFSIENLLKTHKRCRCSKQHKREVISFELNLYDNLLAIRQSILNKTYKIYKYRMFKIYEPKERVIESLSYKHRVVQNCLCENLLKPELEKRLIYDNSACRVKKGTDFARNRLKKFLLTYRKKYGEKGYYLTCDLKKYFLNINHAVLKRKLSEVFTDDIMWLLSIYIDSNGKESGLPIGNQTSQWFALFMLDKLDHIIKETFKCRFYTRYMDDFLIIHNSKSHLKYCLQELKKLLKTIDLKLNNKTKICRIKEGVPYLGFKNYLGKFYYYSTLKSGTKRRIKFGIKRNYARYLFNLFSLKTIADFGYIYIDYLRRCKGYNYFNSAIVW